MGRKIGTVFDIQRFCVHDGPGIRTAVFLKGCPLRCGWCHNPEGMRNLPQIMLNAEKCIGCGACASVCARGVHGAQANGLRAFFPDRCAGCGACVRACPACALTLVGREMSADDVLAEILRDRPFFGEDGGATFSGGEALMQPHFLRALLEASKREGIHTAVDTCGYADWGVIEGTIPWTDLYLYDIKASSAALHRALTGVHNARILENLRRLDAAGARIWVRMPLLRGVNDGETELRGTAQFLSGLSRVERVEMMPYHVLGRAKYTMLGLPEQRAYRAPTAEEMEEHRTLFREYGLTVL